MNRFAALLDALVYTNSRNRKLALLSAYLRGDLHSTLHQLS
ncbi:MAG: hypothetical protein AAF580_15330 [Pseudomonadota bacterium]